MAGKNCSDMKGISDWIDFSSKSMNDGTALGGGRLARDEKSVSAGRRGRVQKKSGGGSGG